MDDTGDLVETRRSQWILFFVALAACHQAASGDPPASPPAQVHEQIGPEPERRTSSRSSKPSPDPVTAAAQARAALGLPDCEWCGADEAPEDLRWDIRIAPKDEPGEPMVLHGVVRHADGSLASGVTLYVYHTDATGEYSTRGDETGNGKRHGRLRGWLRTDENGRYRITTIRPAQYPSRRAAAHVHITVDDGVHPEYWIEDFKFTDDPLLTDDDRRPTPGRGGSGVIELERDSKGVWRGERTILLPEDPPSS